MLAVFFVEPEANYRLVHCKCEYRDEKIRRYLKQFLGIAVRGRDVRGIEVRQEDNEDLRAKAPYRKNSGIHRQLLVFVHFYTISVKPIFLSHIIIAFF